MPLKFQIEQFNYAFNSTTKTQVDVSGWLKAKDGYPAPAARIRLGKRLIECHGEVRMDVIEKGNSNDARIGFRARFSTSPGLKLLHFEAMDHNGRWTVFSRRLIRVPVLFSSSVADQPPTVCATSVPVSAPEVCSIPRRPAPALAAKISIVMPTYNRAENLQRVVRETQKLCGHFEFEWVIIDDGSTDSTPAVLDSLTKEFANLRYQSVRNAGPGKARNLGAQLAKNDVILFIGDDILPIDQDFLRPHAEIHASNASVGLAVLGKVVWPPTKLVSISSVMRHIQGRGGEQFGYADFTAHSFYDWRFFYTCNVSIKRCVVADWMVDGFSDRFPVASYEDAELAYRLKKQHGDFKVFYAPASCAYHLHPYNVAGFLRRQEYAGAMARVFIALHPEVKPLLGIAGVDQAACQQPSGSPTEISADYLSIIEGIKAWVRIMEQEGSLGNEAWHEDMLFAVFEMAYLQGFIAGAEDAHTNFQAAYSYILNRAKIRISRVLESEATNSPSFKSALLGLG